MTKSLAIGWWAAAAVATTVVAAPAAAQERSFDVPAQSATTGIAALARQAGIQILAARRDTHDKRTNAVRGKMSADRALAALLAGTGLTFRVTGAQTYSVVPIDAAATDGGREERPETTATAEDELIVTGTNIRGAEVTSPSRTYRREQIEGAGNVTVEQFARNLPQSFNSTNRETAALGTSGTSDNDAYGTGINLRGLGTGSTLTLVNGRRVAPGGSQGGFVDITAIPLAAVERIDVVTDGASAIYGSDAVAGVVNIVLRDKYDGAETSVYANVPTRGGGREVGASQLLGKSWSTGHAMIVGDYYDARPIYASQRDFVPPSTYPLPYGLSPEIRRQSAFGNAEQQVGPVLTLFAQGSWNHQRYLDHMSLFTFLTNTFHGTQDSYSGVGGARFALTPHFEVELSGSYGQAEQQSANVYDQIPMSTTGWSRTRLLEGEVRVKADLFELPGGWVRSAFGYEARRESYTSLYTATGTTDTHSSSSRDVDGLFGEVNVPLVDTANGMPGLRRLIVSGAIRYDHYSDVGGATSPKVGVLWGPVEGFDLRATWGRSFRPALLSELDPGGMSYQLTPFPEPSGGFINTLYVNGSNPSLSPEHSTAFTAGFEFKPSAMKGLSASASYFSIDYRDRIARPPVVGGAPFVFYDPGAVGSFLSYPADPALVAAAFATGRVESTNGLVQADTQAYFDYRLHNIARMKTSGLEFALGYVLDRPFGTISAGLEGNWIFTLKQQPDAGSRYVKLDDTEFQPADFRANANLGWAKGGASVTAMFHYVGSYRDTLVIPEGRVPAWLTGDLAVSYDFGFGRESGLLSGLRATVAVLNLADADPPRLRVDANANVFDNGYDPTNASAVGRTVSLRLTKAW
ncbi:TonB-dependent receptor [Sphingomonas sp.]|uniref:TonB-dependent receptor plug domain-containing protein n=1 Tax=Sphingomonas sp. TaxID=28214 RepID=UPI001AFDA636|nr:TonB-dependent receptor [Sphingomonas sp.]MBO9713311.1 TonB-dependent receptor [Sphingomonas sp.]